MVRCSCAGVNFGDQSFRRQGLGQHHHCQHNIDYHSWRRLSIIIITTKYHHHHYHHHHHHHGCHYYQLKVGIVTSGCPSPSLGKVINDQITDQKYWSSRIIMLVILSTIGYAPGHQCVDGVCGEDISQSRHRAHPSGWNNQLFTPNTLETHFKFNPNPSRIHSKFQ